VVWIWCEFNGFIDGTTDITSRELKTEEKLKLSEMKKDIEQIVIACYIDNSC
jgi:hypothetical protein